MAQPPQGEDATADRPDRHADTVEPEADAFRSEWDGPPTGAPDSERPAPVSGSGSGSDADADDTRPSDRDDPAGHAGDADPAGHAGDADPAGHAGDADPATDVDRRESSTAVFDAPQFDTPQFDAPVAGTSSSLAPSVLDQEHPDAAAYPAGVWPMDHPPYEVLPPARQNRRTALWVSLTVAVTLLLCAGGGLTAYLLLRNTERADGAPDPTTAVTRFLTAVYTDQDPTQARDLVCTEARDPQRITAKVQEVKDHSRQYDGPRFSWNKPSVATQSEKRATVSVSVTMATSDEKTANQHLTFTVVKKTGWWVCEVATG